MRVECKECGGKARIGSRNKLSVEFAQLYCQCLDPHCGHSFVMNLSFSHSIRPAAKAVDQILFDRLRELPPAQRKLLLAQLGE